MNLLIAIFVALSYLQLWTLVSTQSIIEDLYDLINKDLAARTNATNRLATQYSETSDGMRNELYSNVLPSLNKTSNEIKDYINNLKEQATTFGYNFTGCIESVESSLKQISFIESKAIEEKETVYEHIAYNVYQIGANNVARIHEEVVTIAAECNYCITSDHPEYCQFTLLSKLKVKQEEIPRLYSKEVAITRTNLLQQGLVYKNRAQDYVREMTETTKPYLSLLDICVQQLRTK